MCMRRLQILVPDATFARLQTEAKRREASITDIVRRGIERELERAVDAPFVEPRLRTFKLGAPLVPENEWREMANEVRVP